MPVVWGCICPMAFNIHQKLLRDSHLLLVQDGISYLLHKNAEMVWFILVPHTDETAFYQLNRRWQQKLCTAIKHLSKVASTRLHCDQIQLATTSKIDEQINLHVVASHYDQLVWPEQAWFQPVKYQHSPEFVRLARRMLRQGLRVNTRL